MPLADTDIQSLIVLEVGDSDSGVLAANMATIWASYADKAQIGPRLQELYSKRRAIDVVLGAVRKNVDFTTGTLTVKQSQELDRLQAMRLETSTEIARVERLYRTSRPVMVAALTATAPQSPPTSITPAGLVPDANDTLYSGDVYKPLSGSVA